jgi:hypothetical protein
MYLRVINIFYLYVFLKKKIVEKRISNKLYYMIKQQPELKCSHSIKILNKRLDKKSTVVKNKGRRSRNIKSVSEITKYFIYYQIKIRMIHFIKSKDKLS